MKKTLHALGVSVVLLTLVLFTSCQKADPGPQPSPGGGPTGGNAPQLNVVTPPVGWYNATILISYSTSSPDVGGSITVQVNGVTTNANPHPVPNVTGNISLIFTATNAKGVSCIPQTIPVRVYSQDTSRLAYAPPGKVPVWRCDTARYKNGPDSAWKAGIKACQPTTFYVTNGSTIYQNECNGLPVSTGNPWYCSGGSILWAGRVYQVVFLNETTLVRSITTRIMINGQPIDQTVEETFTKKYE